MRIRRATEADRIAILALAVRLSAFGPTTRTADEVATRERQVLRDALDGSAPESELFVAEDERGVVGVLLMEGRTDYFTGEQHAHISILAVAENAERRGVGTALLGEAERWARARGFRRLTLSVFAENLRAKDLYRRRGWKPELETHFKVLA